MAALISAVIRASRPSFRNGQDRVAFAVHAYVLGKGLKLVAVGPSADLAAASEAPATGKEEEVGPEGWQDLPDAYAFRYAGDSAGGPLLTVKALVAGGQLLLHVAAGSDAPAVAELDVEAYTSSASEDLLKGYKDLDGLAAALHSGIGPTIDKVLRWDQKQPGAKVSSGHAARGNQETETAGEGQGSAEASRTAPSPPPEPQRELDPLRDDPLRVGPPRMPGMVGVGADDLIPGGLPHPGRAGGLVDPSMMMGGGGMHVGPGNPMFIGGGGFPQHPGMGGGGGIPMHPAGARWDPIGPPGMQGFHPDDFMRNTNGRGGRGRGPDIHPDIGPPPGMGGFHQDHMFG